MKLRFSMRVALASTALFAALLYWRTRPSALAKEFADAVSAKNYQQADELFSRKEQRFVADSPPGEIGQVLASPQTFAEWLQGVCRVDVILMKTDPIGRQYFMVRPVRATAWGLE